MRRFILIVIVLFAVLLLYVLIGAIAPFTVQPEVSKTTKAAFQASDYYSSDTGPDRALVIDDNQQALEIRMQMIMHAKHSVILSTFDFRSDEAGTDMLAVLLDAADRGVSVEIFVDGFNSVIQMEGNRYFYALSSHPNVKIIIYNQINPIKPWSFMGRMHDKYVIVDDTAYLLGGRNTFSYFLGSYDGHKNYDRDVLIYNTGSADSSLFQLKQYYETISALDCCHLFHDSVLLGQRKSVQAAAQELRQHFQKIIATYPKLYHSAYDYHQNTVATHTIHLLSNPINTTAKEPVVFYQLMELCKQAKHEVIIHTPYVISNDWMNEAFSEIGSKGIMMFNSTANNGNLFASADYVTHKKALMDTGLELHEYEGGISYHGKSITIDDNLAIIGSFNMDMRSVYVDTELMLVIHSEEVTAQLNASMNHFDQDALIVETEDTYRSIPSGKQVETVSFSKKCFKFLLGWALELGRFLL